MIVTEQQIIMREDGKYFLPPNSPILTKYSGYQLLINNVEIPVAYSSIIQLPDSNVKICRQYKRNVIDHYTNGSISFTIDEYNSGLSELRKEAAYDEEEGFWEYQNLEAEFEVKKFIRDFKPVYVESVEAIEFSNFVVMDVITSQYPDIRPVFALINNPEDMLFTFVENKDILLSEAAKLIGYTYTFQNETRDEKSISCSGHSRYQFMKVNGKYVDSTYTNSIPGNSFRSTYERCIEYRKKIIDKLVEIINHYDLMQTKETFDKNGKGFVLSELDKIYSLVSNIGTKKYRTNQPTALKLIRELQDSIKKTI